MNEEININYVLNDVKNNIRSLLNIVNDDLCVFKGTIVLAIECVLRNVFPKSSRILLIGEESELRYVEYICRLCDIEFDRIDKFDRSINLACYQGIYTNNININTGNENDLNFVNNIDSSIISIVNIGSNLVNHRLDEYLNEFDIVLGDFSLIDMYYAFVAFKDNVDLVDNVYFLPLKNLCISSLLFDEYLKLDECLQELLVLTETEWNTIYDDCKLLLAKKISMLGYDVVDNNSSSYIVIRGINNSSLCSALFNEYGLISYLGYDEYSTKQILLKTSDYLDISKAIKLINALRQLDLK